MINTKICRDVSDDMWVGMRGKIEDVINELATDFVWDLVVTKVWRAVSPHTRPGVHSHS